MSKKQENQSAAVEEKSAKKHVPKPDRAALNQSVETLNAAIDKIKSRLNAIKEENEKLSSGDKKQQEKVELQKKIEAARAQMDAFSNARSLIQDQIKSTLDLVKKKTDEFNAAKDRLPFRSTNEIDRRIAELEAMVSSGKASLQEEKRYLNECSSLRKQRKVVESFSSSESDIGNERNKIDELKRKLKALEPEGKQFKEQLDGLYEQLRASQSERSEFQSKYKALKSERETLSKEMSDLIQQRKDLYADFNKAREEFDAYMKVEIARREEARKKQQEEYTRNKKLESVRRAMERAEMPAFEDEIHLCSSLISLVQSQISSTQQHHAPSAATTPSAEKTSSPSVAPVLNDGLPKGFTAAVALKKKSERMEEENLFARVVPKKKAHNNSSGNSQHKNQGFKFDLAVIDNFVKLKIDVPTKANQLNKTLATLEEKKKYFIENQERVTKENMEKAKKLEEEVLKSFEAAAVETEPVVAEPAVVEAEPSN